MIYYRPVYGRLTRHISFNRSAVCGLGGGDDAVKRESPIGRTMSAQTAGSRFSARGGLVLGNPRRLEG